MITENERIGRLMRRRQENKRHIARLKSELDNSASLLELLARAIRLNHQSISLLVENSPTVSASESLNQRVKQIPRSLIEDIIIDVQRLKDADEEQSRIAESINELGLGL